MNFAIDFCEKKLYNCTIIAKRGTKMNFRINSCGINDCQPNWEWITPKQGFRDYDIWAVFRGNGFITSMDNEKTKYPVNEGAALLLAPGTQYIAEHQSDNPLLVINIHFDFLDENGKVIYPCGFLSKDVTNILFFKTLLIRIITLFNSNQHELAKTFLASALSEYAISNNLNTNINFNSWHNIIRDITNTIDTSKKPPTLAQFALQYGYSERYIGKMFTIINGINFSDYIKNTKISKAKTLLRSTAISIAEIANETGFYDPCHFSKFFRNTVGVSPLSYRNKNQ